MKKKIIIMISIIVILIISYKIYDKLSWSDIPTYKQSKIMKENIYKIDEVINNPDDGGNSSLEVYFDNKGSVLIKNILSGSSLDYFEKGEKIIIRQKKLSSEEFTRVISIFESIKKSNIIDSKDLNYLNYYNLVFNSGEVIPVEYNNKNIEYIIDMIKE